MGGFGSGRFRFGVTGARSIDLPVTRDDFREHPPADWMRLSPGGEVAWIP